VGKLLDERLTAAEKSLTQLNSDMRVVVKYRNNIDNVYVQVYKGDQRYFLQIIFNIEGKKKTLTLAEFTL